MEDDLLIHSHIVHISVGGYQFQVWPLSWTFIASLIATLLIGLLITAVLVYASQRDRDAQHR